jgi:hypothetical protein
LNPIFCITNKPRNDGSIFDINTGIMTKSGQPFTAVKIRKELDKKTDVQGSGEQFLSDIGGDSKVDITPGFNFDSVYFVGMKDIFLKECSLKKCPCRPLPETEINLSIRVRIECDYKRNEQTIVKIRASVSRGIGLK